MSINTTLALYDEFLEFRSQFLEKANSNALFTDERDGKKVRPFVVIKTKQDFKALEKDLKRWRAYVHDLTQLDPIRFDPSASIFKPEPQFYTDAVDVFVRKHNATSTRKVAKARIVSRMENLLKRALSSAALSGDYSHTDEIKRQLDNMRNDDEEFYRIRTEGYTDIMAFIRLSEGTEPIKTRIPFAGLFIYEKSKPVCVSLPDQSRQEKRRKDSLATLGIQSIPCSLKLKGQIYRESELLAAKEKARSSNRK